MRAFAHREICVDSGRAFPFPQIFFVWYSWTEVPLGLDKCFWERYCSLKYATSEETTEEVEHEGATPLCH